MQSHSMPLTGLSVVDFKLKLWDNQVPKWYRRGISSTCLLWHKKTITKGHPSYQLGAWALTPKRTLSLVLYILSNVLILSPVQPRFSCFAQSYAIPCSWSRVPLTKTNNVTNSFYLQLLKQNICTRHHHVTYGANWEPSTNSNHAYQYHQAEENKHQHLTRLHITVGPYMYTCTWPILTQKPVLCAYSYTHFYTTHLPCLEIYMSTKRS